MTYEPPESPFEAYEPRPEYKWAARVTDDNIHELANYINYVPRGANAAKALLSPGYNPYLVLMVDGKEVSRAHPHTHYLVSEPDGFKVVKAEEFRPNWRKRLGDER